MSEAARSAGLPCRSRTSSETWDVVKPLLPGLGITRLGDITGLDRIGIPVWIAVRPNSRTLSVSQGKGLDAAAARISAAMESLETAVAERPDLAFEFATATELGHRGTLVDPAALPRPKAGLFGAHRPLHWVEARDWASGERLWVPYEIVHADATLPALPGSGAFLPSTNGLASGNNRVEAIFHGLCEVVERDAIALWDHLPAASQEECRLDLGSVDDPVVIELLERFSAAAIVPVVWDVTSDVGVATFRAIIFDTLADAHCKPMPAAFGAGCHPCRVTALVRALTEAAQSRLTVISGSRDDFGRRRYAETQSARALASNRSVAEQPPGSRPFSSVADQAARDFDDAIGAIVSRLADVGLKQVLSVDLADAALPVAVARVIVPGLEGPTESARYTPGARVRARGAASA